MQSPNEPQSGTYFRSLASGAVAGVIADLSLFPLDTLKTRLQSEQGFVAAGGFRGSYRGIGSAILASAPSAALFFVTYNSVKEALSKEASRFSKNAANEQDAKRIHARYTVASHMIAGSCAEVAGCIIRVPAEVVKQRAQAGQSGGRSFNALMGILSTYNAPDGKGGITRLLRELYRGGGITLLRELPFTMIQFPLWEALKAWHVGRFGRKESSSSFKDPNKNDSQSAGEGIAATPAALYGSVSGAVAAGVTTPLDVLKTRLMLAKERVGAIEMLRRILKTSGPTGLLAGLAPRTLWTAVGGFIFLGSYQWAWNKLGGEKQKDD